MPASDIVRHGLLVKDAMGAVGGAMYAAITGSKYKNPTRLEVTMLNPEGLQKAINDAFESPEEAFNRLGEKYRDHFTTKAQRAAGILKQGSDKENEDR